MSFNWRQPLEIPGTYFNRGGATAAIAWFGSLIDLATLFYIVYQSEKMTNEFEYHQSHKNAAILELKLQQIANDGSPHLGQLSNCTTDHCFRAIVYRYQYFSVIDNNDQIRNFVAKSHIYDAKPIEAPREVFSNTMALN